MSRKRKHISLKTQLASALACLLPQAERDAYRAARVPAETIIRLFTPDHIWLFSLGGPDEWWNLDPKRRPAHADKSRHDTTIAAKVKRLASVGVRSITPEMKRADVSGIFDGVPVRRPKRKMACRVDPWPPKGSRPFRPSP